MRAAVNPKVRRIWAAEGSQVSKTEGLLNIIGHKFDTDPAPMLYVGPTKSNVSSVIEPRIAKMIRECDTLKAKTKVGRRSKLIKEIGDISLRLAWAGSPTELASEPIHTVLLDEIDRMKAIKGEGNPVFIAEARIATFPDGRLIGASSPTAGTVETEKNPDTGIEHWKVAKSEDVQSQIWQLWQEGTRHEWAMPCLDCGEFFVPRFKLLKWADKATPREAAKTARLACPNCGVLHDEPSKYRMNAGATFLAPGQSVVGYDPAKPGAPTNHDLQTGDGNGEVVGQLEETEVYSFWVSGLCSPWLTYGQRAASYVRAVRSGDQERVRAIINTGFGELYAIKGDAPKPEDLRETLGAPYVYGTAPHGVQRIYVAVVRGAWLGLRLRELANRMRRALRRRRDRSARCLGPARKGVHAHLQRHPCCGGCGRFRFPHRCGLRVVLQTRCGRVCRERHGRAAQGFQQERNRVLARRQQDDREGRVVDNRRQALQGLGTWPVESAAGRDRRVPHPARRLGLRRRVLPAACRRATAAPRVWSHDLDRRQQAARLSRLRSDASVPCARERRE
jgi:hypothetical protein